MFPFSQSPSPLLVSPSMLDAAVRAKLGFGEAAEDANPAPDAGPQMAEFDPDDLELDVE